MSISKKTKWSPKEPSTRAPGEPEVPELFEELEGAGRDEAARVKMATISNAEMRENFFMMDGGKARSLSQCSSTDLAILDNYSSSSKGIYLRNGLQGIAKKGKEQCLAASPLAPLAGSNV